MSSSRSPCHTSTRPMTTRSVPPPAVASQKSARSEKSHASDGKTGRDPAAAASVRPVTRETAVRDTVLTPRPASTGLIGRPSVRVLSAGARLRRRLGLHRRPAPRRPQTAVSRRPR